jgi:indolepyruvate decarboxylase
VNRARLISASSEGMTIGYHQYPDITLIDLVDRLLGTRRLKTRKEVAERQKRTHRRHPSEGFGTMNVVDELNRFLDPEEHVVVADVGDALYASVELETDDFLGLGYYNSMGFGVPAAVAAQLALPKKRT